MASCPKTWSKVRGLHLRYSARCCAMAVAPFLGIKNTAAVCPVAPPTLFSMAQGRLATAPTSICLMLLGSPPDMVHSDVLRGTGTAPQERTVLPEEAPIGQKPLLYLCTPYYTIDFPLTQEVLQNCGRHPAATPPFSLDKYREKRYPIKAKLIWRCTQVVEGSALEMR